MSTRAYFIGGPLDGNAHDWPHRPPNLVDYKVVQQQLPVGPPAPEDVVYEKHFVLDDDGSALHYYVPEGKHATALRALLETRIDKGTDHG